MTMNIRTLLACTTLLLLASCSSETANHRSIALPEAEAGQLLINRNWMDLRPESETEKLSVFRFVPSMGGGVFQDRTLFEGSFELFTFQAQEGQIRFDLHHTKQKVSSSFRIERVHGPKPFDLKLTIESSPRGPDVYFGRSEEMVTDLGLHPLQ